MNSISDQTVLKLFERMSLVRLAEQQIMKEYAGNEMKTPVHLSIGEEAIPVGVLNALPENTTVFGTYRSHAMYLAKTQDLDGFFGEMYGALSGACRGKAGSMHLMNVKKGVVATSAVVSTTIPVAVGAAFANKYRNNKEAFVTVFFGDGAMEEGVFWESLNFACIHNLKILFVCENNELAIHAHPERRRGFKLAESFPRDFNCQAAHGPGYNVLDVVEKTQSLRQKMEETSQPGFLRLDYVRFLEHVGINEDFESGYRTKPEFMADHDPIGLLVKAYPGLHSEFENIKRKLQDVVEQACRKASAAPKPTPSDLLKDLMSGEELCN